MATSSRHVKRGQYVFTKIQTKERKRERERERDRVKRKDIKRVREREKKKERKCHPTPLRKPHELGL